MLLHHNSRFVVVHKSLDLVGESPLRRETEPSTVTKTLKQCVRASPWVVKLKSDGFSLPLGSLTLGSRSSSKKECAQASSGVRRAVGVYSSRREHKAMASGGVRGRNTCAGGDQSEAEVR